MAGHADPAAQESFFAELIASTRPPWTLGPVLEPGHPDAGDQVLVAVIDPPDDRQVAELDDTAGALDDLEVICGASFDDLLDVLDITGQTPAAAADDLLAHFGLDQPPSIGWTELAERLNLYGRALRYDLFVLGYDLADWARGRWSWDHLLDIAARLPAGTHYKSAMQADDELAAAIAEVHGPPSKRPANSRPALEGFTRELSYLHRIDNRLQFLGWAVLAAQATRRGAPPRPAKGPETADERYEFRDYMREHVDVVSRVLVGPEQQRMPAPEAVRGAVHLDPPPR